PQPDPGEQLLEPERLGHVVVGAALQAGDGVVDRGARGEDDHGQCRAALPEPAQHGEAVDVGQPDVEHEELEVPAQRQDQRLLAGRHRGGGVPGGTQPLGDERGDPRLVLGDENLRHYLAPSWSVSSVVTSSGSTTTSSSASVLGRNPGAGSSSV